MQGAKFLSQKTAACEYRQKGSAPVVMIFCEHCVLTRHVSVRGPRPPCWNGPAFAQRSRIVKPRLWSPTTQGALSIPSPIGWKIE